MTDTISPVAAPWPAAGTTLFRRLHRVSEQAVHARRIRHRHGRRARDKPDLGVTPPPEGHWVQKPTVPCSAGLHTHHDHRQPHLTGGGSRLHGWSVLTDTTNSFVYNPVANTIGTIAAIPRATGETRALNFNGKMLVMGGGRTAPNPSNEVDAYDPGANSWAVNSPVPAFANARRNFPTDTDGTTRIWLAGGYDATGNRQTRENGSAREVVRRRQHQRLQQPRLRRPRQQQQYSTPLPTGSTPRQGTTTSKYPTPRPRPTPAPRP